MQLDNVIGIAGTALNAQSVRMNTTASNLANANSVAGSEQEAFRGRRPLFKALLSEEMTHAGAQFQGGVKVDRIVNDPAPIRMMAASRSYQNNVEVVNTARQLMSRTVDILKA